jgi:hypothetical protein
MRLTSFMTVFFCFKMSIFFFWFKTAHLWTSAKCRRYSEILFLSLFSLILSYLVCLDVSQRSNGLDKWCQGQRGSYGGFRKEYRLLSSYLPGYLFQFVNPLHYCIE